MPENLKNKFNITVTAENGSTKTYTLIVNVIDPNPIKVTIDEKELTIVKRESTLETPQGFEKTQIEINEQKIPAFYNEINKLTIIIYFCINYSSYTTSIFNTY